MAMLEELIRANVFSFMMMARIGGAVQEALPRLQLVIHVDLIQKYFTILVIKTTLRVLVKHIQQATLVDS